jgi:hypothetical protein
MAVWPDDIQFFALWACSPPKLSIWSSIKADRYRLRYVINLLGLFKRRLLV